MSEANKNLRLEKLFYSSTLLASHTPNSTCIFFLGALLTNGHLFGDLGIMFEFVLRKLSCECFAYYIVLPIYYANTLAKLVITKVVKY